MVIPSIAQRVADTNARLAAEGRCFMHNSYETVPARYLMELPIGNVVPLCTPCRDWWVADAEQSDDPMTQPVRIMEIGDERCGPPE